MEDPSANLARRGAKSVDLIPRETKSPRTRRNRGVESQGCTNINTSHSNSKFMTPLVFALAFAFDHNSRNIRSDQSRMLVLVMRSLDSRV
jgi:hypothetical protein